MYLVVSYSRVIHRNIKLYIRLISTDTFLATHVNARKF